MNKKITVIAILFLMVSVYFAYGDSRQDLYLKAVGEKNLETRVQLLKDYLDKFGSKDDKFLRFIYLNLCDAQYQMKNYEEAIQYGEIALQQPDIDPSNKQRILFYLANSYYVTKNDYNKAINYSQEILNLSQLLIEQAEKSDNKEQAQQLINHHKMFFISPAYQLQAKALFSQAKDNAETIKQAAEKAVLAYENDKSENSAKMAFSLAVNLFKKDLTNDAIHVVEKILDETKPQYDLVYFLATCYYKMKNKDKAVHYYELSYKLKRKADMAIRIGKLVHKSDIKKGIKYFAEAYILLNYDKSSDAYKFLEHLYFNIDANNKTAEEKEKGFKEVIAEARQRLGMSAEEPNPPTTEEPSSSTQE